jgi:hypothetical protein
MYSGGTIFCDHATGHISLYFHLHQKLNEILEAKQRFKNEKFQNDIVVERYQIDNGIFAARDLFQVLKIINKPYILSVSGAHHQNGVAEQSMGTFFPIAQTMLILEAALFYSI